MIYSKQNMYITLKHNFPINKNTFSHINTPDIQDDS